MSKCIGAESSDITGFPSASWVNYWVYIDECSFVIVLELVIYLGIFVIVSLACIPHLLSSTELFCSTCQKLDLICWLCLLPIFKDTGVTFWIFWQVFVNIEKVFGLKMHCLELNISPIWTNIFRKIVTIICKLYFRFCLCARNLANLALLIVKLLNKQISETHWSTR